MAMDLNKYKTAWFWLLVIAGFQLGLQSVFGFNLLDKFLGGYPMLVTILNGAFGVAAAVTAWSKFKGQ